MTTYRTRGEAIEAALRKGAASAYVLRIKHGKYTFVPVAPDTPAGNPVGVIRDGEFRSFTGK